MKLRLAILMALAMSTPTVTWAQAASEELALLSKMEAWTFWMMVTGVASAIAASFGAGALVWTFREQRKLTLNQERAFLQVDAAGINLQHQAMRLSLRNTGRSHALDVYVRVNVWFVPVLEISFLERESSTTILQAPRKTWRYIPRKNGRPASSIKDVHFGSLESGPADASGAKELMSFGWKGLQIEPGGTAPPQEGGLIKVLKDYDLAFLRASLAAQEGHIRCIGEVRYEDIHGHLHTRPLSAVFWIVPEHPVLNLLDRP